MANKIITAGNITVDSDNNIIISTDGSHLVALIGINNSVVIAMEEITLVFPKNRIQDILDASMNRIQPEVWKKLSLTLLNNLM